jgi:glycerol uptake facilitator protein
MADGSQRRWRWQQSTWGELCAEALGTFVLIAFGCGVVAMAVAALNQSGRGHAAFTTQADWLLIVWGWAFAVAFGVYVAGGISGAHINPAVTLGFALRRGFPWKKVPSYWAAQLLGAFAGGFLVYFNYKAAINSFDSAQHITRGASNSVPSYSIFATFPAPYFKSWWGPFGDQVIGTAFLMGFVFAVTDEYNAPVKSNLAPLIVGFIVGAIGLSYGANAGYAINPARDFGPRLVTWIEGWKSIAMPGDYGNVNTYFWIPIVGPLVGAAIGAFVYDFGIRNVLIARGATPDLEVEERGEDVIDRPSAAEEALNRPDRPGGGTAETGRV